MTLLSLDLGSGPEPAPGYVGVDLLDQDEPRVVFANLWNGEPWPFEDGSVERLRASHVIEHIPHSLIHIGRQRIRRQIVSPLGSKSTHFVSVPTTQDAFFWFFDEAWRVAQSGCRFELSWPHPQSDPADQDPTHTRRIPSATLHYLSKEGRAAMRVTHYPVTCDWRVESCTELAGDAELSRFTRQDGSVDVAEAKRHHGVFHEIVAVLVKP
jgi:hypothetical protein